MQGHLDVRGSRIRLTPPGWILGGYIDGARHNLAHDLAFLAPLPRPEELPAQGVRTATRIWVSSWLHHAADRLSVLADRWY